MEPKGLAARHPETAAPEAAGPVTAPAVLAEAADELDGLDQEALRERLEEARRELDAAAVRLGELHRRLYASEMQGSFGKRAMLGVLLGDVGQSGGVEVVGVTPGSGAERAGLRAGDELTAVGSQDITLGSDPVEALRRALEDLEPGDRVSVGYLRDGSFALAEVTTQAHGMYIMGIAGVPQVDVEIEGVHELEALADRAAQRLKDLPERLEALSPGLGAYFGADEGVLVLTVPDASAPDAPPGLEPGDVLLAVAGEPVADVGSAYRALWHGEQDIVSVEVLRHGAKRTLELRRGDQRPGAGLSTSISDGPATFDVRIVSPAPPL